MASSSSSGPPRLQLSIPSGTGSFKRSFEEFDIDLEAGPDGTSTSVSISQGLSNGSEPNKRARSEDFGTSAFVAPDAGPSTITGAPSHSSTPIPLDDADNLQQTDHSTSSTETQEDLSTSLERTAAFDRSISPLRHTPPPVVTPLPPILPPIQVTAPLVDEEMGLDDIMEHGNIHSHMTNSHYVSFDSETSPVPTETVSEFHVDLHSPTTPESDMGLVESTQDYIPQLPDLSFDPIAHSPLRVPVIPVASAFEEVDHTRSSPMPLYHSVNPSSLHVGPDTGRHLFPTPGVNSPVRSDVPLRVGLLTRPISTSSHSAHIPRNEPRADSWEGTEESTNDDTPSRTSGGRSWQDFRRPYSHTSSRNISSRPLPPRSTSPIFPPSFTDREGWPFGDNALPDRHSNRRSPFVRSDHHTYDSNEVPTRSNHHIPSEVVNSESNQSVITEPASLNSPRSTRAVTSEGSFDLAFLDTETIQLVAELDALRERLISARRRSSRSEDHNSRTGPSSSLPRSSRSSLLAHGLRVHPTSSLRSSSQLEQGNQPNILRDHSSTAAISNIEDARRFIGSVNELLDDEREPNRTPSQDNGERSSLRTRRSTGTLDRENEPSLARMSQRREGHYLPSNMPWLEGAGTAESDWLNTLNNERRRRETTGRTLGNARPPRSYINWDYGRDSLFAPFSERDTEISSTAGVSSNPFYDTWVSSPRVLSRLRNELFDSADDGEHLQEDIRPSQSAFPSSIHNLAETSRRGNTFGRFHSGAASNSRHTSWTETPLSRRNYLPSVHRSRWDDVYDEIDRETHRSETHHTSRPHVSSRPSSRNNSPAGIERSSSLRPVQRPARPTSGYTSIDINLYPPGLLRDSLQRSIDRERELEAMWEASTAQDLQSNRSRPSTDLLQAPSLPPLSFGSNDEWLGEHRANNLHDRSSLSAHSIRDSSQSGTSRHRTEGSREHRTSTSNQRRYPDGDNNRSSSDLHDVLVRTARASRILTSSTEGSGWTEVDNDRPRYNPAVPLGPTRVDTWGSLEDDHEHPSTSSPSALRIGRRRGFPGRLSNPSSAVSGARSSSPTELPSNNSRSGRSYFSDDGSTPHHLQHNAAERLDGIARFRAFREQHQSNTIPFPSGLGLFSRPSRLADSLGDFVRDEEFDDTYEALLSLGTRIGTARPRGVPASVLSTFRSGVYRDFAGPDCDKRCPICLDDYQPDHSILKLNDCRHWLHRDCLEQWLQSASTCPVCRKTVRRTPLTSTSETGQTTPSAGSSTTRSGRHSIRRRPLSSIAERFRDLQAQHQSSNHATNTSQGAGANSQLPLSSTDLSSNILASETPSQATLSLHAETEAPTLNNWDTVISGYLMRRSSNRRRFGGSSNTGLNQDTS